MNSSYTRVPRKTTHTFHLLMTLLTCGAWLPVWLVAGIWATRRKTVRGGYASVAPQPQGYAAAAGRWVWDRGTWVWVP